MNQEKRTKQNNFTRGGQITFHNLRMFFQVNSMIAKWTFLAVFGLTLLITYIRSAPNSFMAVYYNLRNNAFYKLNMGLDEQVNTIWNGVNYKSTLGTQLNNETIINLSSEVWFQFKVTALICSLGGLIVLFLLLIYFRKKGDEQTDDLFVRGIKIATPKEITAYLKRKGSLSTFSIDKHRLFKKFFEFQHLLIDGTTGVGKSILLRKFLKQIRKRGDKAIIYDKGCTFVGKFYQEGKDTILNPFDERCVNWDIWCDAKEAPDFENMANALIPQHGEGDPFWVDSARTIFSSTSFKMMNDGKEKSTTRLLHLVLTSELEELGKFLKGTESASLVSEKIEKTAISIKSVLATYIKSLRFLDGLDAKDENGEFIRPKFSITDWVQNDKEKGFLFLSSNAQQHASLRPLISMWLAIASNAILGLKENSDRRIWVILDEMPTLHKLPELDAIIAEVRKFGGCYVIGIQSYAQLEKTYGKTTAEVIFDLLNTRFYFRSPSSKMAKVSSLDLGEQEIDVSKENYSYGAHEMRDGVSVGHQTITRPVVSASEIQTLDDLQCWTRLAGCNLITRLDLIFDEMKNLCSPFMKRDHKISAEMNEIYEKLVYLELMATQKLDDDTKSALAAGQTKNFENEQQLNNEWESQKKAIEANKQRESTTPTDLEKSIAAQRKQGEREQADQLVVDDAAIIDVGEIAS